MGKTVYDILAKDKRYVVFMECLKKLGLDNLLRRPNITLFIPINLAFLKKIQTLNNCSPEESKKLLLSHIVPSNIKMLEIGKCYSTLNRKNVIKVTGKNIINKNIKVAGQPVGADNGLIYFIETILFPPDVNEEHLNGKVKKS